MRSIPQALLDKIRKLQMTRAEDADPRMRVELRRRQRYIGRGTLLNPVTIRMDTGLGPWDLCVRRDDVGHEASQLVSLYVKDGVAHMAVCNSPPEAGNPDLWEYVDEVGPALDVACEFDGYWVPTKNVRRLLWWAEDKARFARITVGEPWLFRVLEDGVLVGQQGLDGQGNILSEDEDVVECVSALRGWKNVIEPSHDHGLVVAYIVDGEVRYRTLAEQITEDVVWEEERVIEEFQGSANSVSLFRTNDYRLGVLAEIEGQQGSEIHWALTKRNWAGMALPDHWVSARAIDLSVDFIPITFEGFDSEHICTATGILRPIDMFWGVAENSFVSVENDGDTTLYALCRHFLSNVTASDFVVKDTANASFTISEAVQGETVFHLVLTVDSLNYSVPGDLTLHFLGSGDTLGEIGQDVDPFEYTFTPTGLEYIDLGAPEVEAIWND